MADGSFEIRLDSSDLDRLRDALERTSFQNLDLVAPLSVLGDEVKQAFERAFDTETTPSGEPWAPLAERTQDAYIYRRRRSGRSLRATPLSKSSRPRRSNERRGGDHILQARTVPGWLRRAILVEVQRYSLKVGEHIGPVGWRQEFGGDDGETPARPYIELTPAMEERAAELLAQYYGRRWF